MKVLLLTSTFPASSSDAMPGFVRDQVIAMKQRCPALDITVLAPHYGARTASVVDHAAFREYRFSYFRPRRFQVLAGEGILPSIEARPLTLALVPFLLLFELLATLRLVRGLRPDILYAHWFTPQGVVAAVASSLTGVPYVLTTHANDVRVWRKVPVIGNWVVRWLLPRAKRITAVSQATLDKARLFFDAEEWEELASRVAIMPMGVDVAKFKPPSGQVRADLRASHGYENQYLVLFLGRLASKKGVDYLIDAIAAWAQPGVRLVIAGDGPLRALLEAKAEATGVGAMTEFVGYVQGRDKLAYLHMADVVVVPSVETSSGDAEGFPVVIMEALAAEKLCIASDASGAESVLRHGVNAFIVPQKDARALASSLDLIRAMTPGKRSAVAAAAREASAIYDWAPIADRHCEFLFGITRGACGSDIPHS